MLSAKIILLSYANQVTLLLIFSDSWHNRAIKCADYTESSRLI